MVTILKKKYDGLEFVRLSTGVIIRGKKRSKGVCMLFKKHNNANKSVITPFKMRNNAKKSIISSFKRHNNAKKRNNAFHNAFDRSSKAFIMRKKHNNALKMRLYAFQKA